MRQVLIEQLPCSKHCATHGSSHYKGTRHSLHPLWSCSYSDFAVPGHEHRAAIHKGGWVIDWVKLAMLHYLLPLWVLLKLHSESEKRSLSLNPCFHCPSPPFRSTRSKIEVCIRLSLRVSSQVKDQQVPGLSTFGTRRHTVRSCKR